MYKILAATDIVSPGQQAVDYAAQKSLEAIGGFLLRKVMYYAPALPAIFFIVTLFLILLAMLGSDRCARWAGTSFLLTLIGQVIANAV